MEKELESLADKVERAVLLVERLRADNAALKDRLTTAEAERERLRRNMAAARARVESLMGQIPEEA
jgi:uncharacterized protein (TIGR02449 family)